jgi:hypothetical protein
MCENGNNDTVNKVSQSFTPAKITLGNGNGDVVTVGNSGTTTSAWQWRR